MSKAKMHVLCGLAWIIAAGVVPAGRAQQPALPAADTEEELTVITSDKLTYDGQGRFVVFERNVVVNDAAMKLTADHLTVRFGEDDSVQSFLAVGNVVIVQEKEDRRAWARRATYDVATGEIVLEGEPRVMRGRDMLAGERITFWRDDQRMVCEPRATLVIHPGTGGVRDGLSGER